MKDINPKKNSKEDSELNNKKNSRADEIEEIYRGFGQGSRRNVETEENWTRAVSRRPTRKKWLGIISFVVACLALVMFLFGTFLGKATVTITPKQGDLILSGVEDAYKRGVGTTTSPALFYDTVTKVEDTEKRLVNASGQENVSKKAEGQIVVFNQNTVAQKLVANTRFQAKDGKIFRLKDTTTIPAGNKSTPGSITVNVIADKPGAEYNIAAGDFTIPGFAGTAKFKTVFGRSKTAMAGGFVGVMRKVSQADLDKNRVELQKILRDRLILKVKQDVPTDYVLFNDAIKVKFEDLNINDSSLPSDKAYVAVKASLSGIIFKRSDLAAFFAQKLIPNYDGTSVEIVNIDSLEFALQNKDILDLEKTSKISFSLDGTGHVVWTFDQNKVKERLAGQKRSTAETVWPDFSAIERVKVVFFPPWLWTFPGDKDKIIIDIEKGVQKS